MIPNQMPRDHVFWSSYQKLQLRGNHVIVNNIGYQTIITAPNLAEVNGPLNRFTMPYLIRRPAGKVLIIGAGVGNDVAVAIAAGSNSITAVEIDPMIVELGRELHPQKPYENAKVTLVIDDARHFLRITKESYNLIVFSHVDSHTTLSSYTNVRLDDYLYTVESLREARKHLTSNGFLYLSYWVEQPYVGYRLRENCTIAFGHPPVTLFQPTQIRNTNVTLAYFLTAEEGVMPHLVQAASGWPGYTSGDNFMIKASTDNWPFLPLSKPYIPSLVLMLSFIILLLCSLFVWWTKPPGEPFAGRVFWLGAAFLLLEVHNVSRLALCFGTTWQVNAWTIAAILGTILLSNFTYQYLISRKFYSRKWVAAILFASLAVAYFIPIDRFLSYPHLIGRAGSTIVLTLPIYFAGLLFADAFMSSGGPSFALGWNVLGAVVGGMSESLSFVFGIPVLVILAGCFYCLALLSRQHPFSS
jgi:SAM-dependent methyltransferase